MIPDHRAWEEFITRLAGEEGIHTRLKGKALTFVCDHTDRMAFSRYLRSEYAGVKVEFSVAWFRGRGWRCDCEVLFCSDSTLAERRAWYQRRGRQ
jgi:hypothetical protein